MTVGIATALLLLVFLAVISWLQWSGRWRGWYTPSDPGQAVVFAIIGKSPLLPLSLLGGLVLMVLLIIASGLLHMHALIDVGIVLGISGIMLGGIIAFRQPAWSIPPWIRHL